MVDYSNSFTQIAVLLEVYCRRVKKLVIENHWHSQKFWLGGGGQKLLWHYFGDVFRWRIWEFVSKTMHFRHILAKTWNNILIGLAMLLLKMCTIQRSRTSWCRTTGHHLLILGTTRRKELFFSSIFSVICYVMFIIYFMPRCF